MTVGKASSFPRKSLLANSIGLRGPKQLNLGGRASSLLFSITSHGWLFQQQHGVDHVDDAILAFDIGFDHFRAIHFHASCGIDGNVRSLQRLRAIELYYIGCHDFSGHHVILEDGRQLLFVGQQSFENVLRNFGESLIRWAKTVNGPSPFKASTNPAALTAATRVVNDFALTAVSTMSSSART